MICADAELSKLDEDLGQVYAEILETYHGMPSIKQKQREWLQKRDRCPDTNCLKKKYQERIAVFNQSKVRSKQEIQISKIFSEASKSSKEHYGLLMSRNDELCNHMLELFNSDLEKYGPTGDSHQTKHKEFKRVPWKQGKYFRFNRALDKMEYEPIEGALFDFNNDGKDEFVVRWEPWKNNLRSHFLYVLTAEKEKFLSNIDFRKYFLDAKNTIDLTGMSYPLTELPKSMSDQYLISPRVLEPFVYQEVSYLLMRPLFEEIQTQTGYAVIAKYRKGKFGYRSTSGEMEDICYFTRTGLGRKQ